ncbi:MAG: hypothetical protein QM728_06300 [Gordonia sp. (in: high G+C Gram-positive bacteria)]|uniref:hypothetical protein n=1 Tax=Gordonia sp. (in: high G+C Gram-positive bacteria) TaxID=84139 RepID=UPI0039E6B4F4
MNRTATIAAILSTAVALGTTACTTTTEDSSYAASLTAAVSAPIVEEAWTETPVRDIGRIGQWMIAADGKVANWLGMTRDGKPFHEPINVIFVDAGARSGEDAKARLVDAMTKAGYPERTGHSAGYRGIIDGQLYSQLPERKDHAFSTHPFPEDNNHGRIFGPAKTDAGWVFVGALSREDVDYKHAPPQHVYDSFNRARDDLAAALDGKGFYRRGETVPMNNADGPGAPFTTGDHDGNAVVVRAK